MRELKAVFFDIDNTLYNTGLLAESSRKNAVKAMIEAGLAIDEEKGYQELMSIVKRHGPNYDHHYDVLVKKYMGKKSPRIVAAGMIAYHTTKIGYLVPYPETIPSLLTLKQRGYKLGVISNGIPTKQWEKLIRLGLQHFFDIVEISTETVKKPNPKIFRRAINRLKCKPEETLMVGDSLMEDIYGANRVGMTTVQVVNENSGAPKNKLEEPDYAVFGLGDILKIVK